MPQKLANEMSKSNEAKYGSRSDTQPRETQENLNKWEKYPYPRAGKKSNISHSSSFTTQTGSITQSITQSNAQIRTQSMTHRASTYDESSDEDSDEYTEEETKSFSAKSNTTKSVATKSSTSRKSIGSRGGLTITSQPKSQTSVYERRAAGKGGLSELPQQETFEENQKAIKKQKSIEKSKTTPLSLLLKATQYFCQIKYVHRPFEQGILTKKDGSLASGIGCSGCFCVVPCIYTFNKLDTRIQMFDLPKLRIFSKDGIRITVNGQVYYRILNPRDIIAARIDPPVYAKNLIKLALRKEINALNVSEIFSKEQRDKIEVNIKRTLNGSTIGAGLEIDRFFLKDTFLPEELHKTNAKHYENMRIEKTTAEIRKGEKSCTAQIKMITSKTDAKVFKNLEVVHKMYEKNPIALHLRFSGPISAS